MDQKTVAIFDMDGTLLDSMFYWERAPFLVLRRYGVELTDQLEQVFHSHRQDQALAQLARERALPVSGAELFAQLEEWMLQRYRDSVLVKAGAAQYLARLREKGVRCVLLTNSRRAFIDRLEGELGLGGLLERCYSVKELPMDKSDPAIYELICGQLGVRQAQCLLFEDSPYAVKAAAQAGVQSVGILDEALPWAHESLRRHCLRVIRRWSELLEKDVF